MDKKGNLIIQSKKEYPNAKDNRIDRVTISKGELAKGAKLKQGDIKGFKAIFYKYCYDLKVTSAAVRVNEANHARELSHCLRHIARAIGRPDLCKMSGDYGKAAKEKAKQVKGKVSKLVKAKVKATKGKRAKVKA
jgi:hypothetical protein